MNRVIVILLVSVLGAGLIACAAHGDLWFGADSAAPVSHGLACAIPLMTTVLATGVLVLPMTGRVAVRPAPDRLLRLPVSLFQPPERSA